MAQLNFAHREITAKVVYYGPRGAGSTTNVEQLYKLLEGTQRSELQAFGPDQEHEETLFFDYRPQTTSPIEGFSLRYLVLSLPGGLADPHHRRTLLEDVDAVVFVASALPERDGDGNLDALLELERALSGQGARMAALPMVLQINQTDRGEAREPSEVAVDLNPYGLPVVPAVAIEGRGVLEAHRKVIETSVLRLRDALSGKPTSLRLTATYRPEEEAEHALMAALQRKVATAERKARDQTSASYHALPTEDEIELPFQPASMAGMRAVRVLRSAIVGDDIQLDVILERVRGGTPRRLRVRLASRPMDTPSVPRSSTSSSSASATPRVTAGLPDKVELSPVPGPGASALSPLLYGMAGLLGGLLIGALTTFLVLG